MIPLLYSEFALLMFVLVLVQKNERRKATVDIDMDPHLCYLMNMCVCMYACVCVYACMWWMRM